MKKTIALILSVLLLGSMCTAFAEEVQLISAPVVTVQIEDCDKNLFYGTVDYQEGMTALEAAQAALKQTGLEVVTKDSPYGGKYIASIGDRAEGDFGGYEGWMYYVDGQSPMYNIAECVLSPGQQLLVAYADMSVLQPIVEAQRQGDQVVITVSADVTTYDAQWNATVTRQPIVGAAVTADGTAYTTADKGQITLSAESAAKENISFQVEQYSAEGLPLVLRLQPSYMLTLPPAAPAFTDVDPAAVYTPYVEQMVAQGVITGYEDNTFRPQGTVRRGEVAAMLYRMAGSDPVLSDAVYADVEAGQWYTDPVYWAVANGILKGYEDGALKPLGNVTRQELAVMLMRYRIHVVKQELPDLGFGAPAFADNADIADYASEAVYLLQKAGVVYNGEANTFRPADAALRSEVAEMLGRLQAVEQK